MTKPPPGPTPASRRRSSGPPVRVRRGSRVPVATEPIDVPEFYGDAAATGFLTGIAAPLLAGAAVAITGVVLQQPDSLRWPGVALLLLVVAASMLIAAVQFGFMARRHSASPDEVGDWWTFLPEAERQERVRRDLADDAPLYTWWAEFARWTYGFGIVALWCALAVAMLPARAHEQAVWRWLAAVVAGGSALFELGWLIVSRAKPAWLVPRGAARRRYERLGRAPDT